MGAGLYGVPVLGGHATVEEGAAPNLSTFAVGRARAPLSARNARPGDAVTLLACLEGEMMVGGGQQLLQPPAGPRGSGRPPTSPSSPTPPRRRRRLGGATMSMPGVAGSLLQLCESAGASAARSTSMHCPPAGLPLERWLVTFPSYAFLLVGDPRRWSVASCRRDSRSPGSGRSTPAGSCAARRRRRGAGRDLGREPLTGLGPD